jgi:ABC-type multidrug transport system ATPase subunit
MVNLLQKQENPYRSLGYMPQGLIFKNGEQSIKPFDIWLTFRMKSDDLPVKINQTLTLVGLNGVEDKKIKYLSEV